jgi:phosphomethylpyrimidine synthase
MKISQEIRDEADRQNHVEGAGSVEAGMAEMSQKFRDTGGEILVPVAPAE